MSVADLDFKSFLSSDHMAGPADSAHDIAHVERVVKNAELILKTEVADRDVVIAAAWLHDCVTLPKNHPDRTKASSLAARKAARFLRQQPFPSDKIEKVEHAIEAHSYSAGIKTTTTEAHIVQDADRLDALGAIGIARCFLVGGALKRALYSPSDPFCMERPPDDTIWTIDHFYKKLLKLPETMNTPAARKEGHRRAAFMRSYLNRLQDEIG